MSEIGKHIFQEQNSDASIRYLAAQKQLYIYGKSTFAFQVIIAVPIPIIISIVTPLFNKPDQGIIWIFVLYSIIATFLEFFCEDRAMKLKNLAASIQEKFDTIVLLIGWNKTLIPNKPDDGLILRYYNKYIKRYKIDKLYGWYSNEVLPVNTNIATLLCQRTNCSYDFTLRERYTNTILLLAASTFVILLILAGQNGITVPTFISSVLFPSLPVFVLAYKQIKSNKEAIENLKELKNLIENELEQIKITDTIDIHLVRQIQDKIYLKR
ncbi:MAG TPA: S-4TM family putative pore-forming effector, partial [Prolixibacteraceae bacterium]|nr:S-4TM family putative pore-forming effector [Prolixibacteraceae bacterium]